jgi:serine protease Do
MRRAVALPLVIALVGCSTLPGAHARDVLDEIQARVIQVNQAVAPVVVHIEAAVKVNNRRKLVTGSGFLIDQGIVLTNEHVVERAEKVSVIVTDREGRYPAEVVGTDKQTDLAVLRIQKAEDEAIFPTAVLGDSDEVEVGEWVIAIGNPYGLDGTVSLGIVSAKGRDLKAANLLNDFIQTDAMIDHGSSGGPLLNLRGEVVGVNSRGQGRGIGFTIPINTAKRVADDLLGEGRIARGYLGVSIQPLDRELARYWKMEDVRGVIIGAVTHDSPAQSAGLSVGDIITTFDGQPISAEKDEDLGSFQRLIARMSVGQQVTIDVLRDGEALRLEATLTDQPNVVPAEEDTDFGFTAQEVTEILFRAHRLDRREGVLISFVEHGSEAEEAQLAPGDLILEVESTPIPDIEAFREVMKSLTPGTPFLIKVLRGDDTRFNLIVPRSGEFQAAA